MESFNNPGDNRNGVNDYMEKLKKGNLPPNPEERDAEIKAGEFDKAELAQAARFKLMTGDKRTAPEIARDWRDNPEKKVA